MIIDLKRCIGCHACTVACKQENGTPKDVFLTRIHQREFGKYPAVQRFYLPLQCNHCESPPCLKACPSGAIYRTVEGVVLVDEDKCVGSKACVAACPYGMIVFPGGHGESYFPDTITAFEEYHRMRRRPDRPMKCSFCIERIANGMQPACVVTCPAEARYFGDLDNPESAPNRYLRQRTPKGEPTSLRPESNARPKVLYLL